MDLPTHLVRKDVSAQAPKAPALIMWVPPSGKVLAGTTLDETMRAAAQFAGEHPGFTVGVYELIGVAHTPIAPAEFTPVERESDALLGLPQSSEEPQS